MVLLCREMRLYNNNNNNNNVPSLSCGTNATAQRVLDSAGQMWFSEAAVSSCTSATSAAGLEAWPDAALGRDRANLASHLTIRRV